MRKTQKKQIEELLKQLEQAHSQIKECIDQKSNQSAMELLQDCQSAGISIGTLIESTEGEGHPIVSQLEEYCELTYQIYENLSEGKEISANKTYKLLRQKLVKVSNGIRNDIPIRKEAVFLPYKASMWDSLESVWQAADADPDCDAYVIPIPYYDRNPDGSFGRMHYEGDQYPENVPITRYDAFDFGAHHPDMIFIHNPYDNMNLVTSIDPFFYSDKLKKVTDCLVYIPYFITAGGMGESKALCPAYMNADYIVIQSKKYREFFDKEIPDKKFLAFGSPKFDSVIRKCQNRPEPPEEWKERMAGKRVYFYNTSIGGMLANTDVFLKKMRYVFDMFKGREDVCLLWRPHPLLESTFDSMRKQYKLQFDALKTEYVKEDIGILDKTADVEHSIALSDVYVGDPGSSVVALFGIVGKPLFILNNYINTLPEKDDWRGEWIAQCLDIWGISKYQIMKNNQLWISKNNDYHYKPYMDLGCEYFGGCYYMKAIEVRNKVYVLPYSARNVLIIEDGNIKRIDFRDDNGRSQAFGYCYYNDKYIFLIPYNYPYLVRINTEKDEVTYVDGIRQFNLRNVNGEQALGGVTLYGNELVVASPTDNNFVFLNIETLETRMQRCPSKCNAGTMKIAQYGDELWLLPIKGVTITCWNPKTNYVKEFENVPDNFESVNQVYGGYKCNDRPFGNIAISNTDGRENIVVSPCLGNMYLSLDRNTGKMEEWKVPIEFRNCGKNGYFLSQGMGGFFDLPMEQGNAVHKVFYAPERKIYDINIDTNECKEIEIKIDREELKEQEPGFAEQSEWMPYCLFEGGFNSLKDFLDNDITGNQFDRERQLAAFSKINANTDGTCGKNVYDFVKGKIE